MHVRARSTARRIRALAGPSGRRSPVSRTPAAWSHDEREPEQGRQLLDASLQRQDLLPKFRTPSGPPHADSPRHSAKRRATHAPSIAGRRDPWRGGARPCVGRVPGVDGHSAAAGGVRWSCRHHRCPLNAQGTRGLWQPGDNSRRGWGIYVAHSRVALALALSPSG